MVAPEIAIADVTAVGGSEVTRGMNFDSASAT